ncbi:hypothetical protein [Bartonella capreoli]|uniref:hypothetical protein n=1 Tax=Bartonella TaxID=773 RepID=UPI003CCD726F
MSRVGVGRVGVGRDAAKKDNEREDALRENGGEVIIKKGEVVGEDEAGVDEAGVDEANANGEIYPLPWESKKRVLTQTEINICFFKVLKYRGKKCVIKKDML